MSFHTLVVGPTHVECWTRVHKLGVPGAAITASPSGLSQREEAFTSCSCMRSASKLLAFFSFSLAVAKISSREARASSSSLWKSFV